MTIENLQMNVVLDTLKVREGGRRIMITTVMRTVMINVRHIVSSRVGSERQNTRQAATICIGSKTC